ncbi:chemokine-like receptor 1 isoform X2 [Seriola lalandi dorsalis]|uniref:chemokine-like receptor 1 isoform X2 n=1 Tax=Seriola lalandi dorsalis TaxID=1841481 RepID=UPI000C6FA3FF|nr:chemokine-like receptor 1 isoform X2 [Seriola lalandi dorsalis]XP_056236098.1 chemerin-like receptor 1 isoform X2 [Seriola aureovittata]
MVNVSITSNSSTTSGLDSTGRYNYLAIATMVIYSVIFLVGTMGNGLVIYVTGCRMKKTVNSIWFLNLALADFLFTAFLLFMIISVSQDYQWHFGHFMCKLNNFVGVVNMFASVFLLMAISLDRCLSIWVVVWAQNKRTTRKAQIITAVIWVAAVKKLKQSICVVLESALAEDRLSLMSSRSLSSHLSRISRKSESAAPTERKGTGTSLNFTECKVLETGERETLSTE